MSNGELLIVKQCEKRLPLRLTSGLKPFSGIWANNIPLIFLSFRSMQLLAA